jgi:hypothetical protein
VPRFAPWPAVLLSALVLAGCGGGGGQESEAEPEPTLAPALANDLADRSEAIAEAFEGGDPCSAAHQADDLVRAIDDAIAAGDVPASMRRALRSTAVRLQNEINCPPPEPEEEDQEEEEKKEDDEEKGKDKDGKNGGGENGGGGEDVTTITTVTTEEGE